MLRTNHPKQHGLFVECFVEYANTTLVTEAHASTFCFWNCTCLFTSHAHHFSSLFKWINELFKAILFKKKQKKCTAAVSTASKNPVFFEHFLNYKRKLNSVPCLRGNILTDLASNRERLRDWRNCDGPWGSRVLVLRAVLAVRGAVLQLYYSHVIGHTEMSVGRYHEET